MLFVHHGIFWGGSAPLRGALGQRVRMLIENDIHLYAAHLSLDAHPEYGNNAGMAQQLGLTDWEWFGMVNGIPLGIVGNLPKQLPLTDFTAQVDGLLNTSTRVLAEGNGMVRRVGILSGSGIKYMSDAATMGADTFLTGETDHSSYYMAADHGINVLFAGHYATETVGVQLIGHHLAERFGIEYKFFDFPTGM